MIEGHQVTMVYKNNDIRGKEVVKFETLMKTLVIGTRCFSVVT